MNKKGFTLIELLAVIVILAIIALIATPIVLSIISDSKENAQLRSAEFYLDAVEYAIANSVLNNVDLSNGMYYIEEDGNLCAKYVADIESETFICGERVKIDVNGEKPNDGYVIVTKGNIKESKLMYENMRLMFLEKDGIFISDYELGEEIVFNPEDQYRTWNIISETKDKVTLMLNENIKDEKGNNINWISDEDYALYNNDKTKSCKSNGVPTICSDAATDEGPITAFNFLSKLTVNWNVEEIDTYEYVNNIFIKEGCLDYQKLEIKNGITTITDDNGNKNTLEGETKARLLTFEEFVKIIQIYNPNLSYPTFLHIVQLMSGNPNMTYEKVKQEVINDGFLYKNNYLDIVISSYDLDEVIGNRPDWLFSKISDDGVDQGYYILSTISNKGIPYNWVIGDRKRAYIDESPNYTSIGIRPVIEVSKSKLK